MRGWLAKHPRFHLHFTPTYSSWLNQVERWFGIITQKAIRRGAFTSTKQLRERIETFTAHYNQHKATPFKWTATANSILEKIRPLCEYINGASHKQPVGLRQAVFLSVFVTQWRAESAFW